MGGPYGKGGKGAKLRGGQAASRCTLREVCASSDTTLEFADWVMSLQDQVDLQTIL